MEIRCASKQDSSISAELFYHMWNSQPLQELKEELEEYICGSDHAVFLAYDGETPVAVAQCSLRRDYVEGTDSSPVGYLEGVFVLEGYRRQGIGRELCRICEDWAVQKGCREFASDCTWNNEESRRFHLHTGFSEAGRIICFVKPLRR